MKHFHTFCIALLLSGVSLWGATAQNNTAPKDAWESRGTEHPAEGKTADSIEISGKDGSIVIRTTRKTQIKVYTILGQLVTDRTVNAGVSELKIEPRGIYLVKAEGQTQKVAL